MTDLQQRLQHALSHMLQVVPGDTIIVGVSGGPDSLALLHLLVRLREALQLSLHVAHLDHGLRADESAADAAAVASYARDWGVPATIESCSVAAHAQMQRINLHQAGRELRYALFARLALQHNAQAVAVAHTANDQAETVLLHLLRGAGMTGLRGIRPFLAWSEW